jgi:hypothetical protein
VCPKRYARSIDLRKHLLTHTGDKPYAYTPMAEESQIFLGPDPCIWDLIQSDNGPVP